MDTLASNFYICKGLREAITARGRPFPSAIRIAPSVIIMWNHLKGMTDVFSRCQKDVKPIFKSLHPYAFIWIRLIMAMVWNVHVLVRLGQIGKRIESYKSLEQIHNALNRQGSFQQSILRCALRYKLEIAYPLPVKANVNPPDCELSRLKDTNKS